MFLAEAVRFELTRGVNPRQFSRLLPSTTRPRFRYITKLNYHRQFWLRHHISLRSYESTPQEIRIRECLVKTVAFRIVVADSSAYNNGDDLSRVNNAL